MNRRSKYMWTDQDRERKMEVPQPPKSALEASLSEAAAGPPSTTTTEVATQPPVEVMAEPVTEKISEVPAIKIDRELQGTDGNTEVSESAKEFSAQGTEKREGGITHPQLVEGAPNTTTEAVEETEQIKGIVALRRKMLSEKVSVASTGNPAVASTTVDVVSLIVLEIPVNKAAPETEKAKTPETVGEKEKLETENIAQSPVMTDEIESQGSDRTTAVGTPPRENSVQVSGNDGESQDGDEMIEVPEPVKEFCAQAADVSMNNDEEDERANGKAEVPEPVNESPSQVSEKRETPAATSGLWKENISVTPGLNDTDDDWPVETTEYPEPLKKASAKAPESQEETTEASGIEGEATQILLEEGAAQKVESFKKTLALRRMLPSMIPDNELILSTIHELTPSDMANILDKMGCLDCKAIPSPYRLFQCPRGHHYCFECGAKRFTKDDKGDISSGSCDHEMEDTRVGCEAVGGVGNGSGNPDFLLADGKFEELSKDEKTGKAKCCLRIRKSTGDVLYKAIYNNTKWDCPNMELGCREKIFGRDLEEHTMGCIRKFGFL